MPWTATVLVFLRDQKGVIYPVAGTAVQRARKVIRRLDRRAAGSDQDLRHRLRSGRSLLPDDARDQARHFGQIVGGGEHDREPV
jgi:hypothetical protein